MAQAILDEIESVPAPSAIDRLWMVQRQIASTWSTSGDALREMAREWISNAAQRDFTGGSPHPELLSLVTDIVRDGQEAGELRTSKDARFVAGLVIGAISSVFAGWLDDGDAAELERATHDALDLLLEGMAA